MSQHGQESLFNVQKSETKRLIEQLIMQETFSREECTGLIKLLISRVVDWSTEADEKISLANSPGKIVDHEDADRFNKTVLEAEKWFHEKKMRSSSVTELVHGTSNHSSTAFEHGQSGFDSPVDVSRSSIMRVESGVGSPVDVARSPLKPLELRTPLTAMDLFEEGTSHSFSHENFSSSKRWDSLDFGSWDFDQKLHTVRSKETDDMLHPTPAKIDLSLFGFEPTSLYPGAAMMPNKQYYWENHKDHTAGRLENVVGWYHSHPGYGCWLSGIDVSTQMLNQQFQEPFLAVVIDPTRTVSAGKVDIGAFRTYPEGYKPPDEPVSEYQTIPLNKIEDFGVHCKQYYALDITYFKSFLDCHLLDLLWNKYWVNTLSSSPLLGNGDYVAGQISDLAEKIEQAENQLSHSRFGSLIATPQRKKEEESQLTKITRDSVKITVEQVHGLMSQVIKDILFNSVRQSNKSQAESSDLEPMVET